METGIERSVEFTIGREVGAMALEAKGRRVGNVVINVVITASELTTKEIRYKVTFRKSKDGRSLRKVESFNREEYEKGVPVRVDKNLHVPSVWYNPMAHWARQILFG